MNHHRGFRVGILLLLILSGCSKKNKTLNVEGSYTPVIVNLSSDREPPVRGDVNALTAVVSNPRGYAIQYHWSAGSGTLTDSTSATAHWTPPDSIGVYPVTVSIVANDPANNANFFKTRTFQLYVDNQFVRWTRTIAIQSDVVPPTAGRLYYTEIRTPSTGESDVWALASPLGAPEQITRDFWQATAPTVQSDGSRVAFLAKLHSSDGGVSIWQVPGTGGDTTSASLVVRYGPNTHHFIGPPRFAPSGSILAYSSDTLPTNFNRPKLWTRDAANMAIQPVVVCSTWAAGGDIVNAYWNPAWNGNDSVVVESYVNFQFPSRQLRGFYKFLAVGSPPVNPPSNLEPFVPWLVDLTASEPDWAPDGQHIVFARQSTVAGRTDRDLWIINAGASNPSAAVQVTSGPADEYHPRFSSDGSAIFFMSNRVDGYGANGFHDTERRGVNVWSVARFDRP